ncbi:hypothetical protein SUGI_0611220 [Cryptomeria japonica]|nr:hypothetical protein SUGI_0611220 [Cryptomeria japonica]
MDKKQNRASVVWTPPKTRNFKINFDGASRGNPGKSGFGAIIRNEFGNLVGANYGPLGINTNNMAEMAGLLAGLEWCVARGIQDVEVEGDSQIILNGISKQTFENWKLEAVRPKIQRLCDRFNNLTLKHIYREGNLAVGWLANCGINFDGPIQLTEKEELPDGLVEILAADKGRLVGLVLTMAYFRRISYVNCENALITQLRNLFSYEEYVYDSVLGLVGITLNTDRHWFHKTLNHRHGCRSHSGLEEDVRVSILKVYFQFENYLRLDSEEDEEREGDDTEKGEDIESSEGGEEASENSEEAHDLAHREVWRVERERLKTFGDEAWEIFRCTVFNGNMEPFHRIIKSDDWWLLENSTRNAITIGEYATMIYKAIEGQV